MAVFAFGSVVEMIGEGGSEFARILPRGSTAMVRAVYGVGVTRALRAEGVIRDPSQQEALGALQVLGGELPIRADRRARAPQQGIIFRQIFQNPIPGDEVVRDVQIGFGDLLLPVPQALLVANGLGNIFLNAVRWRDWVAMIAGGAGPRAVGNDPQIPPAGINPAPLVGEIHPWLFGGILHIRLDTGAPIQEVNPRAWVAELSVHSFIAQPFCAKLRADAILNVVHNIIIVTSAGNLTRGKARKLSMNISREMAQDIDIDKEVIMKGWDFLLRIWDRTIDTTPDTISNLFETLQTAATTISLRLGIMCEQTELKMLTAITVVLRTIRVTPRFPWDEVNQLVIRKTGRDELLMVRGFLDVIQNTQSGNWLGWCFQLRTTAQGNNRSNFFPHILHCSLELAIRALGSTTLREYQGLEGVSLPCKLELDNVIAGYLASDIHQGNLPNTVPEDHIASPNLNAILNNHV